MYYEINVSKQVTKEDGYILSEYGRYVHLFATAKRSITGERELKRVYHHIKRAFPEPMFNIIVTRWDETGTDMSNFFKLKK
jgi:hypothetical protein